jgi:hypothetical protein
MHHVEFLLASRDINSSNFSRILGQPQLARACCQTLKYARVYKRQNPPPNTLSISQERETTKQSVLAGFEQVQANL